MKQLPTKYTVPDTAETGSIVLVNELARLLGFTTRRYPINQIDEPVYEHVWVDKKGADIAKVASRPLSHTARDYFRPDLHLWWLREVVYPRLPSSSPIMCGYLANGAFTVEIGESYGEEKNSENSNCLICEVIIHELKRLELLAHKEAFENSLE